MAEARLTPRAEHDLRDIWLAIALDNESAADRVIRRLLTKFDLAAEQPGMGSPRPELSKTARILVEGRYLAIYEPQTYGILVVAVVHGMRDPTQWL